MAANSLSSKGRSVTLSFFNAATKALNLAREASSIAPAKAVFGSASVLLVMIKVLSSTPQPRLSLHIYPGLAVNEEYHVEIGFFRAGVCQALDRGLRAG